MVEARTANERKPGKQFNILKEAIITLTARNSLSEPVMCDKSRKIYVDDVPICQYWNNTVSWKNPNDEKWKDLRAAVHDAMK